MKHLILIRGLPGSGKTTLARMFAKHLETDQFFMHGNEYKFDAARLPEAHADCQARAAALLDSELDCTVAVSNTFTMRWELEPYIAIAESCGAKLTVISLFDGGCTDEELFARNEHGVPTEVIARMRGRFEHDWQAGDPTPPWLRTASTN